MQTRRNFIGNVATGLGGLATGNVLGANDRIRFGVIGAGERGTALTREALACPNAECGGFADVYTRRLEGISIWVVPSKDITASDPAETDSLFEPARDKIYRHPTFYDIPDEVKTL